MPPKVPPLNQASALHGFVKEQVVVFLTSRLSDDQLRLIGEISILWNSTHARLQYFVWQVANWIGGVGPLVTADLQVVALVILARNIVDNRIKDEFARECADATINLYDVLRVISDLLPDLPSFIRRVCSSFALRPNFGSPEAGVFRLFHDGGLAAPTRLSNIIGVFWPIAPCGRSSL
jgi:hypothetical protein